MFTTMRKRIWSFLLLAFSVLCLSACSSLGEKPKNLQGRMEIPEDGIIEAAIFQELKEENGVITFNGESEGVYYEWTVFGSDIEEYKDCNLAIHIDEEETGQIVFQYLSDETYGFSAVLSIYLNELWDAQSATVYQMDGSVGAAQCSASITGNDKSILNFSVENPVGIYYVTPDVLKAEEENVIMVAQENEDTIQDNKALEKRSSQTKEEYSKSVDSYLSQVEQQSGQMIAGENANINRVLSSGTETGQDQYLTDPVPEGKPMPVEPENQQVNESESFTCTFSIECSTILNNLGNLEQEKLDEVPSDGMILASQEVVFYEGESVYDVLQRVCQENGIQIEASWTPIYNSAYVEGIHNLYEFDCGSGSGWMYRVDGWYPNYGCSRYQLKAGEVVEWRYTCDLGKDIGGSNVIGG